MFFVVVNEGADGVVAFVAVAVRVGDGVIVNVFVGEVVKDAIGVLLAVGVQVGYGVRVGVIVIVGVLVGDGVQVGVLVSVGVLVGVSVGVLVGSVAWVAASVSRRATNCATAGGKRVATSKHKTMPASRQISASAIVSEKGHARADLWQRFIIQGSVYHAPRPFAVVPARVVSKFTLGEGLPGAFDVDLAGLSAAPGEVSRLRAGRGNDSFCHPNSSKIATKMQQHGTARSTMPAIIMVIDGPTGLAFIRRTTIRPRPRRCHIHAPGGCPCPCRLCIFASAA